jgi:myo-inositol-1(or 4)-monophosphatase
MMDSSNWLGILRLAAENIYDEVSKARLRGAGLENRDYKHLLDDAAQCALVDTLQGQGVSAQLISEEGNVIIGDGGPVVIADPVDGTTNLARSLHPAVTCLSVSDNGSLSGTVAAVVKDLYTGETYAAERGKGAALDGHPITIAAPRQARSALVSIDISKTPKLDRITPMLNTCRYIRMLGSSATELSLIASGNLDAHIDIRGTLRATDAAAALTILKEAGGTYAVNGAVGGDFPLTKETVMELVVASNTPLLDELLSLTKSPSSAPA